MSRDHEKEAVLREQGGLCAYCGRMIWLDSRHGPLATWDEIVPRSAGGSTTDDDDAQYDEGF